MTSLSPAAHALRLAHLPLPPPHGSFCGMRGRKTFDASTDRASRSDWWGVVLDAPDAPALAHFYADLLGWAIATESPEHCTMGPEDGVAYLATQTAPDYVRPVWPNRDAAQQMMLHLDFEVADL